jgi:two-component system OmpR family response regulator
MGRASRTELGTARVLVVDGDAETRRAVTDALRHGGFTVYEAAGGREAERAAADARPDLIVLDVVLPDGDGLALARRLAERGRTSVIFLTALGTAADRVAGLAVADDYVLKPFAPAEVVARVRAVLRRTRGEDEDALRFADVVLDPRTHQAWRAAEPLDLTPTEFDLLRFFLEHPRRVLSKDELLHGVWHGGRRRDASIVETYVGYLRRKLERAGPPLIRTIRLVGYALREPRPSEAGQRLPEKPNPKPDLFR